MGKDILFELFRRETVFDSDTGYNNDFGSRVSQQLATDDTVVRIGDQFA